MASGTAEGPSPTPPERASWRTRYSGLIDRVSSLGLPVFIHRALRQPPPPTAPGDAGPPTPASSCTRAPLGLIDIVRPSAAACIIRPPRLARPAAESTAVDDDDQQPPSVGVYKPRELLLGRKLVEVFSVSATFHFVGGIDVCHWQSSKTIFWRKDWDEGYKSFFFRKKKWQSDDSGHSALLEFEDPLVLTGPPSAIMPYGGFVVRLYIPATKKKDREVLMLHWDSEERDPSIYNRPMTRTMVTRRGRVHVTCAVLDDAVQASVRVTLRLPHEAVVSTNVHGHINARIDTFSVGCALFSRDADEPVDISVSRDSLPEGHSHDGEFCHSIVLPLNRRVLVVPVRACVQVWGKLVFNGSNVISVSHLIKVEGERVESQGVLVQENYCSTTVDMWFMVPWG